MPAACFGPMYFLSIITVLFTFLTERELARFLQTSASVGIFFHSSKVSPCLYLYQLMSWCSSGSRKDPSQDVLRTREKGTIYLWHIHSSLTLTLCFLTCLIIPSWVYSAIRAWMQFPHVSVICSYHAYLVTAWHAWYFTCSTVFVPHLWIFYVFDMWIPPRQYPSYARTL